MEEPNPSFGEPNRGSAELEMFRTLLEFHQKTVLLLRRSSLDADAKAMVYERLY